MGSENGAPATATGRATASPPRGQLHKERLLQTVQATRSHINILVATQPREPACNRDPPSHTTPSSAHSGSGLTARRVSTFTCARARAASNARRPPHTAHASRAIRRQDASYPHAHYSTSPQHGAAPVNVPGSEIRDNKPAGGSPPTKNRQQIRQSSTHNGQRRITSSPQCTVDGEDWGAELQTTYLPARSWQPRWRSP